MIIKNLLDKLQLLSEAQNVSLNTSDVLFPAGSEASELYIVMSGRLEACTSEGMRLGILEPGDPAGEIAVLLGGTRNAEVRALEPSLLGSVSRKQLIEAMEKEPLLKAELEAVMQKRLLHNRLRSSIHSCFPGLSNDQIQILHKQLELHTLQRDEVLFQEGDEAHSLFISISGILEVYRESQSGTEISVAFIRPGETIGEMALLNDNIRTASIRAARTSIVASLSRPAFEAISRSNPGILMEISRLVVSRLQPRQTQQKKTNQRNGTTIALIAAGSEIIHPEAIAKSLADNMPKTVSVRVISRDSINRLFRNSAPADAHPGDSYSAAIDGYLKELEDQYDLVLLAGDPVTSTRLPSPWEHRCLSQADELLLCMKAGAEGLNPVEQHILSDNSMDAPPVRSLLLIHNTDSDTPRHTRSTLQQRNAQRHFHCRSNNAGDIARVARLLTGHAVGVTLGGGGARGVAHVGVLRALQEAAIPVDCISGTSMGAVVGAMFGAGASCQDMINQIHEMFVKINPFNEYTLPVFSLLRGRKAELTAHRTFRGLHIEDLWIPFSCVSTNISKQKPAIHSCGRLSKAILATTAIPGIVTPIVIDGDIHVDGSVCNNLPGDILPPVCSKLIACDVNPAHNFSSLPSQFPSPWSALLPARFRKTTQVPKIGAILTAALNSGSYQAAATVLNEADIALTPPVADIGLLDFSRAPEIEERGYRHTIAQLEKIDAADWFTTLS
ncbi:cyclic nucleotide-binding domain-containing protein [Spirochaeta dissipatitropha]